MSLTLEEQGAAVSLISRYARSVDAADMAGVLQCFADDVSLSYDGGRLLVNGRQEAEAFFRNVSIGTPVEVRCSRRVDSSPSRRLICWLRAEVTRPSSVAARPMLPSSTTRTK